MRSAPGRDRTCDQRIRNPLLYPLSYERLELLVSRKAGVGRVPHSDTRLFLRQAATAAKSSCWGAHRNKLHVRVASMQKAERRGLLFDTS